MEGAMRVACKDGDKVVGHYEINTMPGCPQIAVSNHAFINPAYRHQGYGKRFHAERLKMLKELGFNLVVCTVKTDNIFQKKILTRFGWGFLQRFYNHETGNEVELWSKVLTNA